MLYSARLPLGTVHKGAENHNVLMSILQTVKLNGLDPIRTLENILLPGKKNLLPMAIGPPEIDFIPSTEDYFGGRVPIDNGKKKLLLPSAAY